MNQGFVLLFSSVFLIDHSWTYLPENCYQQLHSIPGLAKRMANLMDLLERPATPISLSPDTSSEVGLSEVATTNGVGLCEEEEEGGASDEGGSEYEDEEELETAEGEQGRSRNSHRVQ